MSSVAEQVATVGQQFRTSPAVAGAIESIVGELRERRSTINRVRGPLDASLSKTFAQFMEEVGKARGRALYYPFLGSAIGNGPFVEMMDGSVKLDLITGIGVNFFGHSDPDMVQAALESALSDVAMEGHLLMNHDAGQFSTTLLDLARRNSRMAHVFLANAGVMANENALKICYQKHAPASRVIAFKDCFMGRSVTMAQIGDSAANRQGIPLSTLVDYMPFYDPAVARRMSAGDQSGQTRYIDMCVSHLRQYIERYPKQHACFIFELIQGEGGFNTAPREFFTALFDVCRAHNIAIWDDEIQTFGRTPRMFAYEHMDVGQYVDVLCVGKMTQVCATLFTSEYNPQPGLMSATFLGSTTALAVGQKVLERLRDGGYYGDSGSIARHHKAFTQQVRALAGRHPAWFPENPNVVDIVGGVGGMMRFTPFGGKKDPVLKLCKTMFEEGVIAFYCGHDPYHMRILPPLGVMDEALWPEVFRLIETAMAKVANG